MRIGIIITFILLTSCSLNFSNTEKNTISELERIIAQEQEENKRLKLEIEKLSDQVRKLKSGLWNNEFGEVTPVEGGLSGPEEMNYEEVTNENCIKQAQEEYIKLGNQQCKQMGLSEADIKDKKCKLSREFIDVIQKKLQDKLTQCGPGI